jgi:hypothetical protein
MPALAVWVLIAEILYQVVSGEHVVWERRNYNVYFSGLIKNQIYALLDDFLKHHRQIVM